MCPSDPSEDFTVVKVEAEAQAGAEAPEPPHRRKYRISNFPPGSVEVAVLEAATKLARHQSSESQSKPHVRASRAKGLVAYRRS